MRRSITGRELSRASSTTGPRLRGRSAYQLVAVKGTILRLVRLKGLSVVMTSRWLARLGADSHPAGRSVNPRLPAQVCPRFQGNFFWSTCNRLKNAIF